MEAQAVEDHPKGLLLRALTKGHTEVAGILIDHFRDKGELHYVQENGDNSFYRAAKLGDLNLFKRLLELTEYTLPERQTTKYNALVAAASKGSIDILSLIYSVQPPFLEHEHAAALQAVKFDQEVALKFFDKEEFFTQVTRREFLRTAEANKSRSCIKYILQKYGIPKEYAGTEIKDLLSKNIDAAVERCIEFSVNLKLHRSLQSAVSAGDIAKAANLLEQGADINYCPFHANTLLFEATSAGNETMVCFLLNNKANVSLRQSFKDKRSLPDIAFKNCSYSLLSRLLDSGARFSPTVEGDAMKNAVLRKDERMLEILLEKKNYSPFGFKAALTQAAEVNYGKIARLIMVNGVNGDNHTLQLVLQHASKFGEYTIVRLLIEKGVNVNQKDYEGSYPLWIASERGHNIIVQLLLDNGADPNLHFGKWGTALHVATREGHVTIIRILIQKGADVDMYSWQCGTPLYAASKLISSMAIEVLLENGADPNTASDEYGSALYSASQNNSLAAVQLLLEAGADIHASVTRYGKSGCTPLQAASQRNYKDVVRILINHGADVNNPASIDGSALYVASEKGYIEVMQQLLDAGANCSSGATSLTPLQIASRHGHESAVKLLLDRGADLMECGSEGSALYLASQQGHTNIVRILSDTQVALSGRSSNEAFKISSNPLDIALTRGHITVVELLLKRGFDFSGSPLFKKIRSFNSEDLASSALHWSLQIASDENHENIVRLLLKRGLSPNGDAGNAVTETPLYLASKRGHTGIVRRLLDAGANISSAFWLPGGDPLRVATENGHDEVVRLLLERGTNLKKGTSMDASLYIAVDHGHDKVVELLLKFGADPDGLIAQFLMTPRFLAWQKDYKFLELLLDSYK